MLGWLRSLTQPSRRREGSEVTVGGGSAGASGCRGDAGGCRNSGSRPSTSLAMDALREAEATKAATGNADGTPESTLRPAGAIGGMGNAKV